MAQQESIFTLADQFGVTSPLGNWLAEQEQTHELPKNILFETDSDKEFVQKFTDPNSKLYNKSYAEKIEDIGKSPKTFQFTSFKYSELGDKFGGGTVRAHPSDESFIFVLFTKGDAPLAQKPAYGHGPYFALWEETYHAWEVATEALDLNSPTSLNEARAWRFAANAPKNKNSYQYTARGKKFNSYTVAYRIKHATDQEVAKWLALGVESYVEILTDKEYAGFGKYKNKKLVGIYYEEYGKEYENKKK
ncbi:MAG: hypothetical protein ACPGJS_09345 [Flammeovirgaceae bacterium]